MPSAVLFFFPFFFKEKLGGLWFLKETFSAQMQKVYLTFICVFIGRLLHIIPFLGRKW